ncbi:unnamed protein product [Fraxinus pennsylvanica]|uniref:Uncharacterized protein n=1 Tax=Fraxinus pennsylvanica TaxID=56036 RepID=A0AAD2A0X0_9LAMI|nr:unnamed protein product [Fraxinus pennsylvanica]
MILLGFTAHYDLSRPNEVNISNTAHKKKAQICQPGRPKVQMAQPIRTVINIVESPPSGCEEVALLENLCNSLCLLFSKKKRSNFKEKNSATESVLKRILVNCSAQAKQYGSCVAARVPEVERDMCLK